MSIPGILALGFPRTLIGHASKQPTAPPPQSNQPYCRLRQFARQQLRHKMLVAGSIQSFNINGPTLLSRYIVNIVLYSSWFPVGRILKWHAKLTKCSAGPSWVFNFFQAHLMASVRYQVAVQQWPENHTMWWKGIEKNISNVKAQKWNESVSVWLCSEFNEIQGSIVHNGGHGVRLLEVSFLELSS